VNRLESRRLLKGVAGCVESRRKALQLHKSCCKPVNVAIQLDPRIDDGRNDQD